MMIYLALVDKIDSLPREEELILGQQEETKSCVSSLRAAGQRNRQSIWRIPVRAAESERSRILGAKQRTAHQRSVALSESFVAMMTLRS